MREPVNECEACGNFEFELHALVGNLGAFNITIFEEWHCTLCEHIVYTEHDLNEDDD